MTEPAPNEFRWQGFFQHATQPIFLLNRRRRLLFANRAWERCTGLALADVRGRPCRRRAAASLDEDEAVLSACAPPPTVLAGQTARARRRMPGRNAGWWEIEFMPLAGADGLLGVIGVIRVLDAPDPLPFTLPERLMALRDRNEARYRLDLLGAETHALKRLHEQARFAATTQMPITLIGESGTGKAWMARAIHLLSERKQGYFACLDAQRVPATMLGDAFFERRLSLGTIYLRNPGLLPRDLQNRVAEALASQGFPRLIVGFGGDPGAEVKSGRVLESFYCAVSAFTIDVPPLRDRLGELPRLIDSFLVRVNEMSPHGVQGVSADALSVLRAHAWPGNLAELQEVLHQACRCAKGERIDVADLPFHLKQGAMPAERKLPLDKLLEQVERRLIVHALRLTGGNQTRAAEMLEIWRPRLIRRMKNLGIPD
jgi:PAS domain S-box-containing protein